MAGGPSHEPDGPYGAAGPLPHRPPQRSEESVNPGAGHKGQPHEEPAQLYPEPPDPQRPRAQRPEMKALVLTITLGLFAALQAQEPLSTRPETQDFTGTWYVKAMATDKHMPMEKRPDKVSPVTMTALDGGDLEVSFTFMKADQCHEKRIVLQQMAEPGKFSTCGGKKNVYLLELPVEDHYIFYCKGSFHMGKLMGKKPDLNLEALEEFKKFTQRKGLPQESIFLPLQMENCIPESD
ncbi:odorant-binding protein 2b [Manis pentadactyla]|uniref:odorant-binding protein 2b n=1 Tax=Manis pentadactyla TaxID=143292 RepID=UPI00255CCE95|nr:odorant-binding protein 2b [Manis pentadactyla]